MSSPVPVNRVRVFVRRITRHGRPLIAGVGLVAIAVILIGQHWLNTNGTIVYAWQGNLFQTLAKPRQIVAVNFTFQNRSPHAITLESVTFPNRLPPHVHLVGTFAANGVSQGFASFGWPTNRLLARVNGFRVEAGEYMTIVVAVEATASGAYAIGPVSLNAQYPFAFTHLPVQVTNTEGMDLCVHVSLDACRISAQGPTGQ